MPLLREVSVEHLKEGSIMAQRIVYDAVMDAGGIDNFLVHRDLLLSMRSANMRWKQDLENQRLKQTAEDKAKIVFLSVLNVRTLTNARPDLFYDVPFVFTSTYSPSDKSSNHIGDIGSCYQDIHMETYPFICDLRFDSPVVNLDVLDIFAVHQGFNVTTGNYFCRIVPSGHISLEKSVMSTNFSLYVINSNVISPSFTIPFLPAFFLHAQEVYLSDTHVVGTVRISGHVDVLAQIQVKPENERLLTVGSLDKDSPTSIVFQVLLKEYYWSLGELSTKLNLIITSELTSQRVELPVKVRLAGETFAGTCMMSRFVTWGELLYYYRYTIFLVLTMLAVMAGTLYVYSSYIRPLRQVSPDIAIQCEYSTL
uniref:NUP210 C-terminal Ig-like domain-containing protein n=1 Tax=Timema shepardi TaxID=629360 RepID=A0A7R9ARD7_TIMSH|nr:unnamed protein product [Timema shepardi]